MFSKIGVLKHNETPVLESLYNKVAGLKACNCIKKETLTQVFSCKYWEILKNSLFLQNTSGSCFCRTKFFLNFAQLNKYDLKYGKYKYELMKWQNRILNSYSFASYC